MDCIGLPCWLRWQIIWLQCRRPRFDPQEGKIPWRRERQPTPVFLPGEFHGQRSLAGYSLQGRKELVTIEQTQYARSFVNNSIIYPLVQFSRSVMSNSLQSHGLQHTRLPCPSPTSGTCSNSCPSVGDAIQPSHPLSYPFPPAFSLSLHQGLFQ